MFYPWFLMSFQEAFLSFAFGGASNSKLDTDAVMAKGHERVIKEKGANQDHFDIVASHLKGTLQELKVAPELVSECMEGVVKLTR